jgi:tRNA threonylcarbamoyladenosine biosynthesis protein TsaB
MIILAADTATAINTVAVCEDGRTLAETVVKCGRTHAERLLDTVTWVLGEAGLHLHDIDALAISVGPGSFTGLRVGLATWKGLAFGQGLPLVGVPTLAAMSRIPGTTDGLCCPVLDARMGEVFAAGFRFESGARQQVISDCVAPIEAVAEKLERCERVIMFGDGVDAYEERIQACLPRVCLLSRMFWAPRASAVAAEAYEMLLSGYTADAAAVRPVYLRKSQAEQNREAADRS